jgi:RimJ/RimL family protein N-acetyltransferase
VSETVFDTERLVVRRWRDADLPSILAVYGDAEAMRWVGDGNPLTQENCVKWLAVTHTNYMKRGYGMYAVVGKSDGSTIGFCGLVHPGGQVEPEIKYAYLRSHWGRGYASEAAGGMLKYGATSQGMQRIIATAAPENIASHRVLLRAGMHRGALRRNEDGSHTQLFLWQVAQSAA